jgi:hypothetical protein
MTTCILDFLIIALLAKVFGGAAPNVDLVEALGSTMHSM